MSIDAIHVVPHSEGWALRYDRAERIFCTCRSKEEALRVAREHASLHKARILIHGTRGVGGSWLVHGYIG